MKKVAVVNQKGGVGKTTTSVNLGAALAARGIRVLLLDCDPQGNASSGIGYNEQDDRGPTLYEVLCHGQDARGALRQTSNENLWLLPSNLYLSGAEIELSTAISRELVLARKLAPLEGDFDLCLLDCPPSLGLLSVNALSASDELLVPVQGEYYALEGLKMLMRALSQLSNGLGREVRVNHFLLTMADNRTRLSKDVADELEAAFGAAVLSTRIPRNVTLAEAPSFGLAVRDYKKDSPGAVAYENLAEEVCQLWQLGNGR